MLFARGKPQCSWAVMQTEIVRLSCFGRLLPRAACFVNDLSGERPILRFGRGVTVLQASL